MIWSLLADGLVVLHFAFTAFVIFGGFLTWRWPRLLVVHLPALAWGCWVEVSHTICPLTPLENHFRRLGGEAGYSGGFLAHYLVRVLYPPGASSGCSRQRSCSSTSSLTGYCSAEAAPPESSASAEGRHARALP